MPVALEQEERVRYEFPKGTTIFFTDSDRWIATAAFQVVLGKGKRGRDLRAFRAENTIPVYFDNVHGEIPAGRAFWIAIKNGERLRS